MNRTISLLSKAVIAVTLIAGGTSAGLASGISHAFGPAPGPAMSFNPSPLVQSYFYPSFGGYGYSSPFLSVPSLPPPYPYLPKYWWTGYYSTEDPRQAGYNPSAGYKWEEVTTLILATSPKKASILLDGSFIGNADDLGPIQLPLGEHTLRVEAPGYEPSETVVNVQTPSLQQLQINLKASGSGVTAAPAR